ncbi:hypothetical protein KJ807_00620 [Patescibacteria group bacterium]|nr:hypothetical protein [Patescibacteria group bacterium]
MQTREYIQELTGYEWTDLVPLVPNLKSSTAEDRKKTRAQIQATMLENLPFMKKYKTEDMESGVQELGCATNAYVERLIADYYPNEETMKMDHTVETTNNPAKLMLMAFNDDMDSKLRFDAARKLLLMQYIGEIRDCSEKEEDNAEALNYMMSLFNERIIELPKGAKIGARTLRYLVSRHTQDTLATESTEILDSQPEDLEGDKLTRVTPLPSHKTTVTNEAGQEREIFFGLIPRAKVDESRLIKTMRYGCHVGEKDVDLNGIRLNFDNREDWADFFRMQIIAKVKNEIREGLHERLEGNLNEDERKEILARLDNLDQNKEVWDEFFRGIIKGEMKNEDERKKILKKLNNIEQNIEISEPKDSLDGGGFAGSAASSSKDLKIFKLKMKITRADGRRHPYEFQIFLPDGYADIKYRQGVNTYHIDKFFTEGVDQQLFPEHYYKGIDREKAHERNVRRAHEKVWGDNSH